jgi:hypothetical protein
MKICQVECCTNAVYCKLLCRHHYDQSRRAARSFICTFPGCGGQSNRKDYCKEHWRQKIRGEVLKELPRKIKVDPICSFPDCGRPTYAKGLCRPHHQQSRRGVELFPVWDRVVDSERRRARWAALSEEEKQYRVRAMHSTRSFPRSEDWSKSMSVLHQQIWKPPSGKRVCVGCGADFIPGSGSHKWCTVSCRAFYKRVTKYGMSPLDVLSLQDKQNDLCAICGDKKVLQVDHDHETGRIRGLLCVTCNTALGKFKESTEMLQRAIEYLNVMP